MRYDILFRDVILGGKTVSIAISGNRFAAIGELPDAGADKVIECGGKVGFGIAAKSIAAGAQVTVADPCEVLLPPGCQKLDPADTAALTGMTAKLTDAAEDLLDVQGIFAHDAALEHQGVGGGGGVTHLAVARNALIGVDTQKNTMFRHAVDLRDAQVGDAKVARRGGCADVFRDFFIEIHGKNSFLGLLFCFIYDIFIVTLVLYSFILP